MFKARFSQVAASVSRDLICVAHVAHLNGSSEHHRATHLLLSLHHQHEKTGIIHCTRSPATRSTAVGMVRVPRLTAPLPHPAVRSRRLLNFAMYMERCEARDF